MVVDASALLAMLLDEKHSRWVSEQLQQHLADLYMSTVNLAEVLIVLRDRCSQNYISIEQTILSGPIKFIPPNVDQVRLVADARIRFPLNLGDCFAYALAKHYRTVLLAIDADFKKTDGAILLPRGAK